MSLWRKISWRSTAARLKSSLRKGRLDSAKLLLVLPDYDPLTSAMCEWAAGLSAKTTVILKGPAATYDNVSAALKAMHPGGVILVFAGHGDVEALLTDPRLGIRPEDYESAHSVLVDSGAIQDLAGLGVFAYSCRSGAGLGDRVSRNFGIFLGFEDEIPFVVARKGDGLDPAFREPLHLVWQSTTEGAGLDAVTYERLKAHYTAAIDSLKAGESRKDRHASLVRMALRRHRRLLTLKGDTDVSLAN